MDSKANQKLSIDLGSNSIVSCQWGTMTMCHEDANYDIQTTDLGKRMFVSLFSLGDRLINVADHVKSCDNRNVTFTVNLPLSLLCVSGDLNKEKRYSIINASIENNLVIVTLQNSTVHQLSAYSLITYILWYVFYKHTRELNALYTDMYTNMTKGNSKKRLMEKYPVIAIPSCFSSKHVDFLEYALSQYYLPPCVFINQSIAFGMSYGYFRSTAMKSGEKEYFIVVDLGEVFLTIYLIKITKNKMSLEAEFCYTDVGGREFTDAFQEYVINTSGDDRLKDPAVKMQIAKSMKNSKHSIVSLNIDYSDIIIDSVFDDEDFIFEASKSDYFEYCQKLGLFDRFTDHCQQMVNYLHDHHIMVNTVIPLGGGMHFSYLQEIVWDLFKSDCSAKDICLSINMEEDIAGGAVRISHLLVENRICFDRRLKNAAVFNYLKQDVFRMRRNAYVITCGDDYIDCCTKNQWKCYQSITPAEVEVCEKKIADDVAFLLQKSKDDSIEAFRVHSERMRAESICLKFYHAHPEPEVLSIYNRVSKTSTFLTEESSKEFFDDLDKLMRKYHYMDTTTLDLESSKSGELEAIDSEEEDNESIMNNLRASNSSPPIYHPLNNDLQSDIKRNILSNPVHLPMKACSRPTASSPPQPTASLPPSIPPLPSILPHPVQASPPQPTASLPPSIPPLPSIPPPVQASPPQPTASSPPSIPPPPVQTSSSQPTASSPPSVQPPPVQTSPPQSPVSSPSHRMKRNYAEGKDGVHFNPSILKLRQQKPSNNQQQLEPLNSNGDGNMNHHHEQKESSPDIIVPSKKQERSNSKDNLSSNESDGRKKEGNVIEVGYPPVESVLENMEIEYDSLSISSEQNTNNQPAVTTIPSEQNTNNQPAVTTISSEQNTNNQPAVTSIPSEQNTNNQPAVTTPIPCPSIPVIPRNLLDPTSKFSVSVCYGEQQSYIPENNYSLKSPQISSPYQVASCPPVPPVPQCACCPPVPPVPQCACCPPVPPSVAATQLCGELEAAYQVDQANENEKKKSSCCRKKSGKKMRKSN